MAAFWHQLRHLFSGPQLPWMIVWLGLAVLIVGLIVLTRTSWGQSHPLQKCVAMSLLVHLLLAVYATTVQIVAAGSPTGTSERAPINLSLVNDGGSTSQDPTQNPPNRLDQLLAGTPSEPQTSGLGQLEPLPAATLGPPPSDLDAKPSLDRLSAAFTALTKQIDPVPTAASARQRSTSAPRRCPCPRRRLSRKPRACRDSRLLNRRRDLNRRRRSLGPTWRRRNRNLPATRSPNSLQRPPPVRRPTNPRSRRRLNPQRLINQVGRLKRAVLRQVPRPAHPAAAKASS